MGNSKPLEEALKRQSEFVNGVVKYARLVVEILGTDAVVYRLFERKP